MAAQTKVNLGIRGTYAERERLRALAFERKSTVQSLVEAAIRRYLADEHATHPGPAIVLPPGLKKEQLQQLQLHAEVLAGNHDTDQMALVKGHLLLMRAKQNERHETAVNDIGFHAILQDPAFRLTLSHVVHELLDAHPSGARSGHRADAGESRPGKRKPPATKVG